MPLKLVFNPDGSLKSKWWYGVYEINGRRKVHALGIRVKGKQIPTSLKEEGDRAFEDSRIRAQAELEAVIEKAHAKKSARALVEEFYEMETGEKIEPMVVADLAKAWEAIPRRRPPNPRYMDQCRSTLGRFQKFMAEKYPAATKLVQVTTAIANAFMDEETARKVSPKTWNDTLKLLRAAFKHLQPETGAFLNPFGRIPTREAETVFRQPFTAAELKDLLDAAQADDFVRPVLVTAACTAMRRGDCCLLKWADVNTKTGFIRVKTAKTGVTVEIPIFPLLRDELARVPSDKDGFVFPEQAAMYQTNPDGITLRVRQIMEKAGFKDPADLKKGETSRGDTRVDRAHGVRRASVRDFHSFRVTWVTLALTAGVPLELVQKVTGHQTTNIVLKHYFQPGREDFRAALQSAMPALLTNGEKTPIETALDILKKTGAKTWKKDAARLTEILEKLRGTDSVSR